MKLRTVGEVQVLTPEVQDQDTLAAAWPLGFRPSARQPVRWCIQLEHQSRTLCAIRRMRYLPDPGPQLHSLALTILARLASARIPGPLFVFHFRRWVWGPENVGIGIVPWLGFERDGGIDGVMGAPDEHYSSVETLLHEHLLGTTHEPEWKESSKYASGTSALSILGKVTPVGLLANGVVIALGAVDEQAAAVLSSHGVREVVEVPTTALAKTQERFPDSEPRTWVRANRDGIESGRHVVLEGLLGVTEDVGAPYCAPYPGYSFRAEFTGETDRSDRHLFEYDFRWFDPVEGQPTDKELAESRRLFENRLRIYQDRYGWLGLVQLGDKVVVEKRARKEALALCDRVTRPGSDKERSGRLKRLALVVEALSIHPQGGVLADVAAHLRSPDLSNEECTRLVGTIRAWCEAQPATRPPESFLDEVLTFHGIEDRDDLLDA